MQAQWPCDPPASIWYTNSPAPGARAWSSPRAASAVTGQTACQLATRNPVRVGPGDAIQSAPASRRRSRRPSARRRSLRRAAGARAVRTASPRRGARDGRVEWRDGRRGRRIMCGQPSHTSIADRSGVVIGFDGRARPNDSGEMRSLPRCAHPHPRSVRANAHHFLGFMDRYHGRGRLEDRDDRDP